MVLKYSHLYVNGMNTSHCHPCAIMLQWLLAQRTNKVT